MHENVYWRAFLVFVFLCTVWYSGVAVYRYHSYTKLSEKQAITLPVAWEINERSAESYFLIVKYRFVVNGKTFSGEGEVDDRPYLNKWAAERGIQDYANEQFVVWYDPADPDHSSLKKHFPVKDSFSAVFLWGLLVYFVWLGYYVRNYKR